MAAGQQLNKVVNIVEQFIVFKKGEDFEKEMNEYKANTVDETGNTILYNIFLFRNLAKIFKNHPAKVFFLDGKDDQVEGPENKDPNILIVRQRTFGVEDFEYKIVINLRIGDKVIYRDISLPEAIAGLIQIFFTFNILYPAPVDDLMQFLERIVCNFGSQDGARNKKGIKKKGFRDFEVKLNVLTLNTSNIYNLQGFAASLLLESNEGEIRAIFI